MVTAARQAGPVVHYVVQAGARVIETVSTGAALPVGSACGLSLAGAKIFPAAGRVSAAGDARAQEQGEGAQAWFSGAPVATYN